MSPKFICTAPKLCAIRYLTIEINICILLLPCTTIILFYFSCRNDYYYLHSKFEQKTIWQKSTWNVFYFSTFLIELFLNFDVRDFDLSKENVRLGIHFEMTIVSVEWCLPLNKSLCIWNNFDDKLYTFIRMTALVIKLQWKCTTK